MKLFTLGKQFHAKAACKLNNFFTKREKVLTFLQPYLGTKDSSN